MQMFDLLKYVFAQRLVWNIVKTVLQGSHLLILVML